LEKSDYFNEIKAFPFTLKKLVECMVWLEISWT